MPTDSNGLLDLGAVDEDALEPVVKLLLVVAGLVLLLGLVSNLPGLDAVPPANDARAAAALGAAVTLGIIAALVLLARAVGPLVSGAMDAPADVAGAAGRIATHVVLFVAVVVAHAGLEPLVAPLLDGAGLEWTYDLLFLVLALVPTASIALAMVRHLDEATALVTGRLTAADAGPSDRGTAEAGGSD